jgi:hypothetical protein
VRLLSLQILCRMSQCVFFLYPPSAKPEVNLSAAAVMLQPVIFHPSLRVQFMHDGDFLSTHMYTSKRPCPAAAVISQGITQHSQWNFCVCKEVLHHSSEQSVCVLSFIATGWQKQLSICISKVVKI